MDIQGHVERPSHWSKSVLSEKQNMVEAIVHKQCHWLRAPSTGGDPADWDPSWSIGLGFTCARFFQSQELLAPEGFVMNLGRGLDQVLQVSSR